ncbi:PRADC1-like protein [Drosophila madeirensis]|uniref:Blast:PRADC1-like protein n=2 Tax=obscura subgroup TaxID=32357 RepID=A0A3B0IYQ8_DROGU|nr:PRADC1-like protein [Drosophila guanche]XP_034652596.1 PRADC1-like protein [Drosophila subobscura]SPP73294.1 blast:PRADC1-like protein [Drosophila guanche]
MLIVWLVIASTLSRCIRATTTISIPITTQDIIAGDVFFEIISPQDLEYTYRLRPAKDFGITFSEKHEGVPLVLTDPPDACQKLRNTRDLHGSIALMDRGECSFLAKTLQAEMAGAVGAIITEYNPNSPEFEHYIEMIHDNTNRDASIPAGFLLGKNGVIIRSTLQRLKRVHALINIPVNLTFIPPSKINHPPWLGW